MTKNSSDAKAIVFKGDKIQLLTLPPDVEEPEQHPLADALDDFMQRVEDLRDAVFNMVPLSAITLNKRYNKALKAIKAAELKIKSGTPAEASHAGAVIIEHGYEIDSISRSRQPEAIERNLFVGMFSEFDQFTGNIIRALYYRRPDLFSNISKTISLPEMLKHETIDSIKNFMLENEIESFRREGYIEQFSILKNRFDIALTDFPDWPLFIEAGQRRNLMVHCGGIVSPQYIQVCRSVGFQFEQQPTPGEQLELGAKYFASVAHIMTKVAFMLTHSLWRKVLLAEAKEANGQLNNQVYRLLCSKRWELAEQLGEFSLTRPMLIGANDIQHRIRICNTSIARKNLGKTDSMDRLIRSVDWSASFRDFRLAVSILKDDLTQAASLMREIGKRGELIHEISYHQWPLFAKFRESKEFLEAYESIYGYPFHLKAERTADIVREQAKSMQSNDIEAEKPVMAPTRATAKKIARKKAARS